MAGVIGSLVGRISILMCISAMVGIAGIELCCDGAGHGQGGPGTCGPTSRPSEVISASGKVLADDGRPIAGASVDCYEWRSVDSCVQPVKVSEATSTTDGTFKLSWCTRCGGWGGQVVGWRSGLAGDGMWWLTDRSSFYPYVHHDGRILPAIVLRLGKPAILAGTVVDGKGGPVRGAEVNAILAKPEGRIGMWRGVPGLSARTDDQGHFELSAIPREAACEVAVTAEGFAETETSHVGLPGFVPGCRNVRVCLPKPVSIRGRAGIRDTGRPAPGIALWLIGAAGKRTPCRTGPDGRFAVESLAPGRYELYAALLEPGISDEWIFPPVSIATTEGEPARDVKLEVTKGGMIEANVRDAGTGSPVSGASVSFAPLSGEGRVTGVTNLSGLVRVHAWPGRWRLNSISSADHLPWWFYREALATQVTFDLSDGDTQHVMKELKPAPHVTGMVRDVQGEPVVGGTVQVVRASSSPGWLGWESCVAAVTGADGRFDCPVQDDLATESHGGPLIVVRQLDRNLAVAAPLTTGRPMELVAERGLVVKGRVIAEQGEPLSFGVALYIKLANEFYAVGGPIVKSEGQGRFEIRAVPAASRMVAVALGEGFSQVSKQLTESHPGDAEDMGDLSLPAADKSVSGVVVDAEGKPKPHVLVTISPLGAPLWYTTTEADGQGRFVFDCVADRPFTVSVSDGDLFGSADVRASDQHVKVVVVGEEATQAETR